MAVYTFKPTDMLVRSQVTLFLAGYYTKIEDVPNLYNLRAAVTEALASIGVIITPTESAE